MCFLNPPPNERRGATAIEYGIILGLIGVFTMVAVGVAGSKISSVICNTASSLGFSTGTGAFLPCLHTQGYGLGATYAVNDTAGGGQACGSNCVGNPATIADDTMLSLINASDPIVSVYGLRTVSGVPAQGYQDAINDLQSTVGRQYGVQNPANGQSYQYEVATNSGSVYGIFWNGQLGYRNLVTGDTYVWNVSTQQPTHVGQTNWSGQ